MTAEEYLAERPDLGANWDRANDPDWLAANPGNDDIAQAIRDYGSLEDYLAADLGAPLDPPQEEPPPPMPVVDAPPLEVGPSEVFVSPPDDSVNPVDDGSEPPPEAIDIPVEATPVDTGPGDPVQGDPSHVFVGRQGDVDVWQLFDGTSTLTWSVPAGVDSRAVIAGTMSISTPPPPPPVAPPAPVIPSPITPPADVSAPPITDLVMPPVDAPPPDATAQTGIDSAPPAVQTANQPQPISSPMTAEQFAASRPDLAVNWNRAQDANWVANNPGSRTIVDYINSFPTFLDYLRHEYEAQTGEDFSAPIASSGGGGGGGSPPPIGVGQKSDPTHVYVGRDGRGDVWQLYDPSQDRVLEWAVAPGALSGAMIDGTLHDLGPPSPNTIAQRPPGVVVTPGGVVVTNNPPPANTGPGSGGNNNPTTTTTGGNTVTTQHTTRILHPVTGWPIDVLDAWHRVGDDDAGNPVFQLIDEGGTVKQFTIDGHGQVKNLINAPTFGVMVHTTPPPNYANNSGAPSSGAPGGTLLPGSGQAKSGNNSLAWILLAAAAAYAIARA